MFFLFDGPSHIIVQIIARSSTRHLLVETAKQIVGEFAFTSWAIFLISHDTHLSSEDEFAGDIFAVSTNKCLLFLYAVKKAIQSSSLKVIKWSILDERTGGRTDGWQIDL